MRNVSQILFALGVLAAASGPAFGQDDADREAQARADAARMVSVARSAGRVPLKAQDLRASNVNAHAVAPNSDIIDFAQLIKDVFDDAARRRDALQQQEPSEKQRLEGAKRAYVASRKGAQNAKRDAHRTVDAWVKGEKERLKRLRDAKPGKDAENQLNAWVKSEHARLQQLKDRKPGKDLERDVNGWANGEKNRIKNLKDKKQRESADKAFKAEEHGRREAAKNADKQAHATWDAAEKAFKNEERSRRDNLKNAERAANDRKKAEVKQAEDAFKAEERNRRRAADGAERDANTRAKTEWQQAQAAYKGFQEELKNARFEAKSMPRYEKQLRPQLLTELKKLNDDLKGVTNNASTEGVAGVSIAVIANLRPDIVLGYLKGILNDKIRPSVEGGVEGTLDRLFGVLDAVVGAAIKAVVAAVGSIPFVGGILASVAASVGSAIYSVVKRTVTNSVRVVGQRVIRRLIDGMGDKLLAAVSRGDAKDDAIVAAARAAAAESNQHLDTASAHYEKTAAAARAEKYSIEAESSAAAKKLSSEMEAEHKALAKGELEATNAH